MAFRWDTHGNPFLSAHCQCAVNYTSLHFCAHSVWWLGCGSLCRRFCTFEYELPCSRILGKRRTFCFTFYDRRKYPLTFWAEEKPNKFYSIQRYSVWLCRPCETTRRVLWFLRIHRHAYFVMAKQNIWKEDLLEIYFSLFWRSYHPPAPVSFLSCLRRSSWKILSLDFYLCKGI